MPSDEAYYVDYTKKKKKNYHDFWSVNQCQCNELAGVGSTTILPIGGVALKKKTLYALD